MFIGLANNLFVDTPGIANTGAAGWVPQSGGVLAAMSVDWVTGRAWNNGITTPGTLFSCARATPAAAYYQNADLTLSSFAANILRYKDNGSGLLVEEARTNSILQSQTFDNASWGASEATVTPNQVLALDNTLTADLVVPSTNSAGHNLAQAYTSTAASWTVSIYLKPNGYTKFGIRESSVTGAYAAWNLVGAGTLLDSGTITGSSIVALANGWYRVSFTYTGTAASHNLVWAIMPPSYTTGTPPQAFVGDGVSGMYYWGAQVELGAFVTSYMPTTTVTVTRAVDVITFNDLTWFDGTAESMLVSWVGRGIVNANLFTLDTVDDVTLNEQAGISPKLSDAGATYAITTANSGAAGTILKAACRMATNDIALCLNGGTVGTDTTATQPGAMTAARLGVDLAGANSLNGYMLGISAWKSQLLTNAALQSLST